MKAERQERDRARGNRAARAIAAKKTEPTPGERLKAAREALKFSQREMADRLGVTEGILSKWERGWRTLVAPPAYVELSEILAAKVKGSKGGAKG